MNIEKALNLKIGDSVRCPSDRGDAAYTGIVTHISSEIQENINNTKYIWITVKNGNYQHVWPSNRLG